MLKDVGEKTVWKHCKPKEIVSTYYFLKKGDATTDTVKIDDTSCHKALERVQAGEGKKISKEEHKEFWEDSNE